VGYTLFPHRRKGEKVMRYQQLSVSELLVNSINGFPFPGGAGMGKPIYLVPADSATSYFRGWLVSKGANPSDIYATLATAYAACTAYRNDTIFVFPGDYVLTAAQSVSKDFTHIVGVDPNIEGDWTQGGCNIYTTTAAVASTLDISAKRSFFKNLKITNAGAANSNLQAVLLYGEGCVFDNVLMNGSCAATQCDTALAGSLKIDRGGYFPRFYNCVIGSNTGETRTGATNAHLQFSAAKAGYPVDNGVFKNCKFLSISVSATCPMVHAATNTTDRIWLFDECTFYNFYVATNGKLNQVINDADTYYTHQFVLKRCTAVGYTEWQTADIGFGSVQSDMPITGTAGGLAKPPTGSVGN
jgi:hypothetical protein